MTTQELLQEHIYAVLEGNLDAILKDYTEASVIITAQMTVKGLDEIRNFFVGFLAQMPPGFVQAVKLLRQEIIGDVAFVVWNAEPFLAFATDTFIISDGKIAIQTFATPGQ